MGITLNYHASELVNFEVINAMILRQGESVVKVQAGNKIKPDNTLYRGRLQWRDRLVLQ